MFSVVLLKSSKQSTLEIGGTYFCYDATCSSRLYDDNRN